MKISFRIILNIRSTLEELISRLNNDKIQLTSIDKVIVIRLLSQHHIYFIHLTFEIKVDALTISALD